MNNSKVSTENLDAIASNSLYCAGVGIDTIQYSFEIFRRRISTMKTNAPSREERILEMGPAEGVMTRLIYDLGHPLTLVEGSSLFCKQLKEKYPDAEVVNSLFEDFSTDKTFKFIILGHVLEHVDDPVFVLKRIKPFLEKDGVIMAAVPNANSIHRQAAVLMGLIPDVKAFSDLDKHHGHKRVYTAEEFKNDFLSAGLIIKESGGYWLKPLSNSQIEKDWNAEMIAAFMKLGEKYPEIAAETYVIAGV
jgi:2-polyprenyl-3-methyl-5-hydroxy-6-metoxy-1,4-benzoquinol methylase